MGLMDVLNGMQNGPHGQRDPNASGGMSPMTMAILALLAYKAVKHVTANGQPSPAPSSDAPSAGGSGLPGGMGGMFNGALGGLMKGPLGGALGGLLAGGAAGSVLSGGLGDLVKQLQQGGQGDAANSWVGTGTNKPITPGDLANALSPDQINTLTAQTGMSRDELLAGLAQQLPDVINHLTPNGRLPTDKEASNLL